MEPDGPQYLDTKAIAKELRRTRPSRLANPWVGGAVLCVCLTVLSLIANLALYQWGSDKADQVSTLRTESECRSAVAAREAVAGGTLRLKEVELDRTRSASNQALQEAIVAALDDPAGTDSPVFAAAIDDWSAANQASAQLIAEITAPIDAYRASLDDRARITEICAEDP